ncbi:hypothetical protein ACQRBN_04550 [Bariatricus sp. SGI.154]|uniref:hypothetical protein n=1 Tax=Bariatricus sp. SGI.154 TaxID=3420549 RepID=UPI003D0765CF
MKMEQYKAEGTKLAEKFLEKLRSGEIVEASRPNKGKEYTGGYEKMDLKEYKEFLTSYTYKDLFANQEIEYGEY